MDNIGIKFIFCFKSIFGGICVQRDIMNNMINFEGIEIDQELLERTNPIFNTARMTLFQLAAAGYDDAKDVVQKLNLTREDTQDSKTVKADEDDLFINSVVMEIRYFTNGKIAKESGFY